MIPREEIVCGGGGGIDRDRVRGRPASPRLTLNHLADRKNPGIGCSLGRQPGPAAIVPIVLRTTTSRRGEFIGFEFKPNFTQCLVQCIFTVS